MALDAGQDLKLKNWLTEGNVTKILRISIDKKWY